MHTHTHTHTHTLTHLLTHAHTLQLVQQGRLDTAHFDSEFTGEKAVLTPSKTSPLAKQEQDLFANFSYTAEWLGAGL